MNTVNIQSVVGKEFSNCVTSPNHKMTKMIENINFQHAGGIYIHSQSSCSYIDASSCMNSVNLGYNNQSINQIIKNASSHISNFTSYLTNNSMYNLQSTDTQFFLCNADESTEKALEACKKMMNADDDFEIIALDLPQGCMSCKECSLCDMENRLNETLFSFEMEKQAAAIIIKPTLVSLCTFKMCRKIIDVLNELKQKGRILIISDERDIGYFRCGNKYYCDDICLNADIVVVSDNFFSGYFSKTMLVFKKRNFYIHNSFDYRPSEMLAVHCVNPLMKLYEKTILNTEIFRNMTNFCSYLATELSRCFFVEDVLLYGAYVLIKFEQCSKLKSKEIYQIINSLKKNRLITAGCLEGIVLLPMYITKQDELIEIRKRIVKTFRFYLQ